MKRVLSWLKRMGDRITGVFRRAKTGSTNLNDIRNGLSYLNVQLDGQNRQRNQLMNTVGRFFSQYNQSRIPELVKDIHKAEFKIYSQWGDDGIIQFLATYLDIPVRKFIEFGVENYRESNTRFLLINNNWEGLIMDGSTDYMKSVQQEELYWKYDLKAVSAFITKENINSLLTENGFTGEIGLLHIDIDGNDYWVWKAITAISPVIVIMEYNSIFGSEKAWTVPYSSMFNRTEAHYSNLYFGASLTALTDLAKEKGYSLIGSNSAGNNAYFIRNDKLKELKKRTPQEAYVKSHFREGRNTQGGLTYISGDERLNVIAGLDIYNTKTNKLEKIAPA